MNIDKDQILQLLRSQGKDDQASKAGSELPRQGRHRQRPARRDALEVRHRSQQHRRQAPRRSGKDPLTGPSGALTPGATTPCMPLPPDRRAGQEAPVPA